MRPGVLHTCMHASMHTYIHTDIHTYIYIFAGTFSQEHCNVFFFSLAADCNVPQRPPAIIRNFTSIQMVHPHTHTHACTQARTHASGSEPHTSGSCTSEKIPVLSQDLRLPPSSFTVLAEPHDKVQSLWMGVRVNRSGFAGRRCYKIWFVRGIVSNFSQNGLIIPVSHQQNEMHILATQWVLYWRGFKL